MINFNESRLDSEMNMSQTNKQFVESMVVSQIGGVSMAQSNPPAPSADREEFRKQMRERWTAEEESLLISTFIDKCDEAECCTVLTERYGSHPKWSIQGAKLRLDWIVRKVYEKFKNLTTKNESINRFRANWEFISKKSSPQIRRMIYRDIVAIYTAMLSAGEEKREIISKKIMEINKLCQAENKQNEQ
jgi:hypothetical protein